MASQHYMRTAVGALILMLVATGCASKSRTAKTAPPPDRGTATERSMSTTDSRMASADQKDVQGRVANEQSDVRPQTERMVPSDRTGSSNPTATNQAVLCADERRDMTAALNCAPSSVGDRESGALDRSAYSPEAMTACRNRTDSSGHVIFEDSACARKYRTQRTAMGASYENVDFSRESAYYDRYIGKAVRHAKEAEIAANQGHSAEMLRHAELALDQAKEAQRAGNVPGLPEGISELRRTLHHGEDMQWQDAVDHVRHARVHLSVAAGMKPNDIRLTSMAGPAATTGAAAATRRTLSGELIGDETAAMSDGNRQYVLRDQNGQETKILVPADMNQNVKAGDHVQAVLDPDGRVVAINKE